MRGSAKNLSSGLLLLTVSAVFAVGLTDLPTGTSPDMGPGFLPLLLTVLLAVFGIGFVVSGLWWGESVVLRVPWRNVALIVLPVAFFGATIQGLGLAPALATTIFFCTFAGRSWEPKSALTLAVVLVVACVTIFVFGLGVAVPVVGPWLGGH